MFNNILVLAIISGLCFGGWPLLTRTFTTLSGNWIAAINSVGAFTVAAVIIVKNQAAIPSTKNLLIGLLGGLINGIGFLAYTKLIATRSLQLSIALPVALIVMIVFLTLAGLPKEPLTLRKVIGLLGAIIAVILLAGAKQ